MQAFVFFYGDHSRMYLSYFRECIEIQTQTYTHRMATIQNDQHKHTFGSKYRQQDMVAMLTWLTQSRMVQAMTTSNYSALTLTRNIHILYEIVEHIRRARIHNPQPGPRRYASCS